MPGRKRRQPKRPQLSPEEIDAVKMLLGKNFVNDVHNTFLSDKARREAYMKGLLTKKDPNFLKKLEDPNVLKAVSKASGFPEEDLKLLLQGETGKDLFKARQYMKKGWYVHAALMYDKAGRTSKEAVEAYKRAGDISMYVGLHEYEDREREKRCYSDAAEWYKKAGSFERAGDAYWKAGKYMDAARMYVKAGSFERAGDAYWKAGEYSRAAEMYVNAGISKKKAYRRAGDAYLKEGKYADAVEAYVNAGMPKEKAYKRVGDAYWKAGKYMDAASMYEKAGTLTSLRKAQKLYEKVGDRRSAARVANEINALKKKKS